MIYDLLLLILWKIIIDYWFLLIFMQSIIVLLIFIISSFAIIVRTWHFGFHTVIPESLMAIFAIPGVRPKILSKNHLALAHLQHRRSFPLLRHPCADVPWHSFDPCSCRTLSRALLVKMPVKAVKLWKTLTVWPTLHGWWSSRCECICKAIKNSFSEGEVALSPSHCKCA